MSAAPLVPRSSLTTYPAASAGRFDDLLDLVIAQEAGRDAAFAVLFVSVAFAADGFRWRLFGDWLGQVAGVVAFFGGEFAAGGLRARPRSRHRPVPHRRRWLACQAPDRAVRGRLVGFLDLEQRWPGDGFCDDCRRLRRRWRLIHDNRLGGAIGADWRIATGRDSGIRLRLRPCFNWLRIVGRFSRARTVNGDFVCVGRPGDVRSSITGCLAGVGPLGGAVLFFLFKGVRFSACTVAGAAGQRRGSDNSRGGFRRRRGSRGGFRRIRRMRP